MNADSNNTSVPREVIEKSVRMAVANALDMDVEEVALTASLQNELGAESLDYVDIAFTLEREFKVHFPREDLFVRAGDHFGEDSLVIAGVVTDRGMWMLRRALPEVDPDLIVDGMRAIEVPGLFTVQTFVRVLEQLLEAKQQVSRECPNCKATIEESPTLPAFVCPSCDATVPFPSGDDILFADLIRLSDEEKG